MKNLFLVLITLLSVINLNAQDQDPKAKVILDDISKQQNRTKRLLPIIL